MNLKFEIAFNNLTIFSKTGRIKQHLTKDILKKLFVFRILQQQKQHHAYPKAYAKQGNRSTFVLYEQTDILLQMVLIVVHLGLCL